MKDMPDVGPEIDRHLQWQERAEAMDDAIQALQDERLTHYIEDPAGIGEIVEALVCEGKGNPLDNALYQLFRAWETNNLFKLYAVGKEIGELLHKTADKLARKWAEDEFDRLHKENEEIQAERAWERRQRYAGW